MGFRVAGRRWPCVWWLMVVVTAGLANAADKSGTRPQVLSVPTGPGSVSGLGESFQVVLNSGSATESVPLKLPPGTAGMTPQLSLVYDSGAGNGPLGIGWTLSMPSIQVMTERGLPKYNGADTFLYAGA
jgi:Salmonella virulence plasmid 65kDa B protein